MVETKIKRKRILRQKRKLKIRSRIFGTEALPRLSVFRSNKYFYAQLINDSKGMTLLSIDGRKMGLKNNKEDVASIAVEFAKRLKEKEITQVIFDRNGYLYHGVVASFANALRENGIKL